MKYPAVWLMGPHAKGETLSIAFAGEGQHQDTGSKMVHCAPYTSSTIVSKSVSRSGGRSTAYSMPGGGAAGARHSSSSVKCDALLVDNISRTDTYRMSMSRKKTSRWHTRPRSRRSARTSSST
jgi:Fe-S cluster assembly protein SufB